MAHGSIVLVLVVFMRVTSFTPVESARILAVELTGGRSHWNFMSSVVRSLMENGHELTIFTPFPDMDDCRGNCTLIDTSEDYSSNSLVGISAEAVLNMFRSTQSFMSSATYFTRNRCNSMYDNEDVKKILTASGDGSAYYDVLLIEPMISECASHLATLLRIPVVYLSPSAIITFTELMFFGHAPNPAVSSNIRSGHAVPKTFAQRFENVYLWAQSFISRAYYEWTTKRDDPRWYDSVDVTKPSIVFVNSHHVNERSRPLPPNFVPIGGVHLGRPKKIPEDILEFIEDAPHGVILFTFGSTVKMTTLPERVQTAFVEALREIPQRVLLKYEGQLEDQPKNMMIKKWLPQRDILLHPNVKLFISHGGISGVYEAVDAGIPVLGFPLFFDQPRNIENLADSGMAVSMDVWSVTKDSFLKNVLELVNNDKYAENAEIASKRFKDRPMTPAQSVVYWTEYAIRHKGAPHLRSHAINLTWYQYFALDVIGIVLILCLTVLFLIRTVLLKILFST